MDRKRQVITLDSFMIRNRALSLSLLYIQYAGIIQVYTSSISNQLQRLLWAQLLQYEFHLSVY